MFIWCFSIKLQLIKIYVALKSTSTHTKNISEVSVILRVTEKYKKILQVSKILITRYKDNPFFYLEYLAGAVKLEQSIQISVF